MRICKYALLLMFTAACDPAIGRYTWHVGDSTAYELGEELDVAAQLRPRGDAILRLSTVPCYALAAQGAYFVGRLQAASLRTGASPDWVLVQLGSNDFRYPEQKALVDTDAELDAAIAALLTTMPPGARVLWVLPGPGIAQEDRTRLRAALERAPRRVETLTLPEALYGDGIHFGAQAAEAARLIIAELDRLDGRQP